MKKTLVSLAAIGLSLTAAAADPLPANSIPPMSGSDGGPIRIPYIGPSVGTAIEAETARINQLRTEIAELEMRTMILEEIIDRYCGGTLFPVCP
jgi:hypothetical protein